MDEDTIQDYSDNFKKDIAEKLKDAHIRDKALADFSVDELAELTQLTNKKIFKLLIRYLKARNTRVTSRAFLDELKAKSGVLRYEGFSIQESRILAMQDMESRLRESEAIGKLPLSARQEIDARVREEKRINNNVKKSQEE